MAILAFQKPDKLLVLESTDTFGKFEFRPLEPRYGITIGNALRRVLLSSLEGFAITSVKIEGVDHEFATIHGVIEGVIDIILNLKKVRFKRMIETEEGETVTLSIGGKKEFTAEDISKKLSSFKVLNPEQHICSMEESVKLVVTLTIGKGRGWVPADENKNENAPVGTIAIDSIFTPIVNVKYTVAPCRIAQKTDYESLSLEITTDGSIHPKDALLEAAKILIYHFMLFSEDKLEIEDPGKTEENSLNEDDMRMRQLLNNKLTDQDLSVRAINCLKAADIETFADLVSHQKSELMKFRNFGKKSMTEIEALVEKHGLRFGMDISKYKIDK
ncbi:MAG: DNA-directed RNA polymerase subunit alpha [Bacteroidales bacterium]|nr:DNA-directed RNA polymerase subunit alpha [Bacteroidales bacterium]MBR4438457.1 DNA-directed RNA polymerase subunit alpha [Bacteroidales bacterium]MBR4805837.1 DNA-directed RNA polymerase subunit alpha [Bacteroidales bacterium]MBR4980682.1 DNA-directed RNA polymerase subunit alpha [Bacteroidales bacterium]MBR5907259.1 DNA-directed RNA polymerase subunit alpha [Bacteroidales bacterium]